MTQTITNPTPAGRAGAVFLLAQAADLAAGDLNGPAQLHDLSLDLLSEIKPLQVWFKWGVYEPTDEAEYLEAQAVEKRYNPDQPRHPAGSSEGGQWAPAGQGAAGGSTGQAMTGPEVRARLEEMWQQYTSEYTELQEKRDAIDEKIKLFPGDINDKQAEKEIARLFEQSNLASKELQNLSKSIRARMNALCLADEPGTIEPVFSHFHPESLRERVYEAFNEFKKFVGPKAQGRVSLVLNETGRSAYYGTTSAGALLSYAGDGTRTIFHELGHHLEHTRSEFFDAALNFWMRRTDGELAISLNEAKKTSAYDKSESTRPDKFYDPYVGKVYYNRDRSVGSTEVISMGIEAMWFTPAKFAREDPEHFDLIWDLMRSRP